jgi:DNA-binding LacI/PurR family transcriptional regulator
MVAAHAGVSKSVVSRVLQESSQVSPAKREAVTRAIEELGYRPNTVARSLTQRRTNIVGVLVHDLHQPWFVDALEGLAAGFAPTGLLPFIADGRLDRTLDERVLHSFMDLRLDGLILAGTIPETPLLVQVLDRIPSVVLGGRDIDRSTVDVVAQDDAAGTRAALDHLHVLGHRRIHHISGDVGRGFAIRREAYLEWMGLHGLGDVSRVLLEDPSEPGGYAAARILLRESPARRPTALFVSNDAAALGALAAARDSGVRVPQDLSVVGFDGTSVAAAQQVRLTTVDTSISTMARAATDLLISRIAEPGRDRSAVLTKPRVMVRATSSQPQ